MNSLELKTSVDKVEPGGAIDVHGGSELALGEGLGFAQVESRHAPMREGDLNVQRHGDDVRDENKGDTDGPVGQSAPENTVTEPSPVAGHEGNLARADPPSLAAAKSGRSLRDDVEPREEVEVEAGDTHNRVVGVGLVGNHEVGNGVPDIGEVVVGRVKRLEE